MGKQVAARTETKTMSRKHPHEGTEGHDIKRTGYPVNPTSREVLLNIIVRIARDLPVIRGFRELSFLMTGKEAS